MKYLVNCENNRAISRKYNGILEFNVIILSFNPYIYIYIFLQIDSRGQLSKRLLILKWDHKCSGNKDTGLRFMTGSGCVKSTHLLELDSVRTYANAV